MTGHFHFRPELLHAIDLIEFHCRRRLPSSYTGSHESTFRGSGMQFKEFRQYEIGDDPRHISWTTTAKTGKPTLKVYEEEREINVFLLVDTSGSSLFGSGSRRKIDMYSEVVALLAMGAIKSNYRIGLLFFDSEVRTFMPPTRNKEDILQSLNALSYLDLTNKTSDLTQPLTFCQKVLKHRSLLFILSDFLLPSFKGQLLPLSSKHEVILLQGYDDSERLISSSGISEICDPESGEFFLLDAESPFFRKSLTSFYASFTAQIEETASACQADFLPLSVQDDYLQRLVHFFSAR
ncbi:MAG: DUF58 domain-containing protein [Proteobacteria bacterium]|nr:DUF58 domain-containing protein [Pseudomonadota bacterium]